MEKNNYVCYDGVDGDICCFKTENEAVKYLRKLIDTGFDEQGWYDGIEDCFVAKITHEIYKKAIDTKEETGNFIDMIIKKIKKYVR